MSSVQKTKRPFSVLRALAVSTLAVLTIFGCSNIIGLGDYTVAGNAGNAGNAGVNSSEAGAPGEGGDNTAAAGAAGTSNSSGGASAGDSNANAGSSNGGNGGGDAGNTGNAGSGSVTACDGSSLAPADSIVRSCILRGGCDPSFDPIRNISTCVTYNTQAALGESCNSTLKTCADYEACEHIGVAHDDLCGGTKKTRCENNQAINCGNYDAGDDRFFDCTGLGGGCATFTFSNDEVYADCTMNVAPDTCVGQPDSDQNFFCHAGTGGADDLRYYCWGGQAYGASCSSHATCIDDLADSGGGHASCFFDLPQCTTPVSPACENNVVNECSDSGLLKYDCTSVGLTCNTTAAGAEYCLAPGCKAADVDRKCTEGCSDDGSQLTFCYGGAPYTVNCADYGFSQCLSGKDSNGDPFAACRY